jgi:hypothetical protein
MFKRIDRSPGLARFIAFISEFVAKRRGLPPVIGILLVVISFVVQLFNFYVQSSLLDFVGVVTLYVGVLTALIGLVVSEALGK